MQEQNLLHLIIKQESWEDLIHNIVSMEGLDPWNIDLVKLIDSFLEYIRGIKLLDFRIPAKVVLVAAILLKMKSELLNPSPAREVESPLTQTYYSDEFELIRQKISELSLKPTLQRQPMRKVTLEELIYALRKAVKVEERREIRKRTLGRRLARNIGEEEDFEQRIDDLLVEINFFLSQLKAEKVEFSKLVDVWNRDQIIRHFLPLLYLATRGKVLTEQEELFKEIYISKRNENMKNI